MSQLSKREKALDTVYTYLQIKKMDIAHGFTMKGSSVGLR